MTLEFIQTAEDLIDFNKTHIGNGQLGTILKIIFSLFSIALISNFFFIAYNQGFSNELIIKNLNILLIILGIYFFIKIIYPKIIKNAFKKNNDSGERFIELLDEEIIISTNLAKTTFKWAAITKVMESNDSYFIYVAANQAIIIPKRVFIKYDKKEFINIIQKKIKR